MANKSRAKSNPRQDIINSAVSMGIGEIIKLHPRFTNSSQYIASHINPESINQIFDQLYNSAQENRISSEKMGEYLTRGLASYIASGKAFDDAGKKRILNATLEQKASSGFFRGRSARRELEGDRYLDQVIGTWSQINAIARSGGQEIPEDIAKPMKYLSQLGFIIPAMEVMEEKGWIDRAQYSQIKNNMLKGAYESHNEASRKLQEYSMYQKAAAVIIGIFGLGILFFTSGITGAAIGTPAKVSSGLVGVISVAVSCALFLIFSKKKF